MTELEIKVDKLIERINLFFDTMPCRFKDGICIFHSSPQLLIEIPELGGFRKTDYCGVAYDKLQKQPASADN